MSSHYDVIIVGAGSMGMAAGYYLAREGKKTLLIDAFDPPHSNGSHSGDTRLIRHACGEGIEYVPLAIRAQELWDELQQETSETIFRKTGVVNFGPKDSKFVNQAIAGGKQYGLPIDTMNGEEINQRWTGFNASDEHIGCYEPEAGVLFSGNCIRTYRKLALQYGADLITNTPVYDLEAFENFVTVQTREGSYTADKLIVSAGAWNEKLLTQLNLDLELQASRRTIGWFDCPEPLYQSDVFPGFFVDLPSEGVYYGFPSFDGSGLKIGRYDGGDDVDPEYMNREFGIHDRDEGDVRSFMEDFMPQAAGKLNEGKACLFTNTPDENFIIDLHPEYSNIAIAAGFSGHGYKFSSVVGEILSDLVTTGGTSQDISLYSAKRESLKKQGSKMLQDK